MRYSLLLLIYSILQLSSITKTYAQERNDFVSFIHRQHPWVDSVFNSLSNREKIAQLFLVRAHSNLGERYIDSVAKVLEKEKLGGLVVFQGGPVRHANMFNRYQSKSKVPLLITFDGEWGLGMRLADSTVSYPYQMTLGAIQGEHLIYEMGRQIANDFHRIGMHFNFAPVVDINNNPKNPVINYRSFGDNKENVSKKAAAYMNGMVDGGIIASLKHFPGHGDTDVDSHHDLPQLDFSKNRLEKLELYPFKQLIAAGAPAVMVAHMHIPALDNTPNIPSSISKKVVTDLLRDELGFQGLSVTDAMDMNGVKKFFPNGEADIMAIEAGNDLIEISENSDRAINLVEKSIKEGRLQQADIDQRVKKVLAAKYWLRLDQRMPTRTTDLIQDLNSPLAKKLVERLANASVTVLNGRIPINSFNRQRSTIIISVGITSPQTIEKQLAAALPQPEQIYISGNESEDSMKEIYNKSKSYDQVLLVVHDSRLRPGGVLHIAPEVKKWVGRIARKNTITMMCTNPYVLDDINVARSGSIILGYQNDDFMQLAMTKVLLKQIKPLGKLPVSVSKKYPFGAGY